MKKLLLFSFFLILLTPSVFCQSDSIVTAVNQVLVPNTALKAVALKPLFTKLNNRIKANEAETLNKYNYVSSFVELKPNIFQVSRSFDNTKNRYNTPWLARNAAVAYRIANPTTKIYISVLDGNYRFGTSEYANLDFTTDAASAVKEYQPNITAVHSAQSHDLAFNGVSWDFADGVTIAFFSNLQIGQYGAFSTPALFSTPSNWNTNGTFNANSTKDTFDVTGSLSWTNLISNTASQAQNNMALYNIKNDSSVINIELRDIATNNMYCGWHNGSGNIVVKGKTRYGIGFHHFSESVGNVAGGMPSAPTTARKTQNITFNGYVTGEGHLDNDSRYNVSSNISGTGLKRCPYNVAYASDLTQTVNFGDVTYDGAGKFMTIGSVKNCNLTFKMGHVKSTRLTSAFAVDNASQWGAIPFIRISDHIENTNIRIEMDSYEGFQSPLAISSIFFKNSTIEFVVKGKVVKRWQEGAPSDSLTVNRSPVIGVYTMYGDYDSRIAIQGDFRSDSTEIISLKGVKSGVKFTVNNSTLTNASPTKPLIKIETGGQTEADSVLRMTATTLVTPSSSSLLMSSGGGKDTYVHANSVAATAPFNGLYQYTKLIFSEQPKRLGNFDPSQNNVITPPIMSIDTVVAPQIGNIDLGGLVNLRVFRTINADRNIYTDNLLENVEYAVLQQVNINGRGTFYATKGNNTVKYFFRTAAQSGLTPVYEPYFYGNKAGVYKFVRRGNIVYVTEPN